METPWLERISDARIKEIMGRIPREEFVPPAQKSKVLLDIPLMIDCGQAISQPTLVADMTQALELKGEEKVLEIGTGSGYQAAILSQLAKEVYTIEMIPALAEKALRTLGRLGYSNVVTVVGDGSLGIPEHAPYDAIIVTVAVIIPGFGTVAIKLWQSQLSERGRLLVPVGASLNAQKLTLYKRRGDTFEEIPLDRMCTFVPLRGRYGYKA